MSDVQQFHSLQQGRTHLSLFSWSQLTGCQHQAPHLRRSTRQLVGSLWVLIGTTAYAQCPIQFAYPPTPHSSQAGLESPENTLQQDVRASIAAQKNGNCKSAKPFQKRTLSKEDLQELRRVVREHAKSKPLHSAANATP